MIILKVLIVDDAVELNNTIQKILVNQNYEVDCAYDGKREAVIIKYLIGSSEIIVSVKKLLDICDFTFDEENIISASIERLQKILKIIGSKVKIIFIKELGYKICS